MGQTRQPLFSQTLSGRICLSIAYQGQDYHGIQKQKDQVTVSQVLNVALERLLLHPVDVSMAGRTDRGVHATRQVVAFDTSCVRSPQAFLEGVNGWLPDSLRIQAVTAMPQDFHPRYSARARRYGYLIYRQRYLPTHWCGRAYATDRDLNIEGMKALASSWMGQRDFSVFRAAGCQSRSSIRELQAVEFYEQGPWLLISIQADAFLYRMVRKMVRSLIAVGSGHWSAERVAQYMAEKASHLIAPMPPEALYLTDVIYPQEYAQANREAPCWLESWMRGS